MKRAFSLVELLVVIAVVAVLVAVIVPSLSRARMTARQVQCAAQIRAWTQIATTYAADNKDWYMPRGDGDLYLNVIRGNFFKMVSPYIDGGTPILITASTFRVHNLFFDPEGQIPPSLRAAYIRSNEASIEYAYYAHATNGSAIVPRSPRKASDSIDQANRRSVLFADVHRYTNLQLTPLQTTHQTPGQPVYEYVSSQITGLTYRSAVARGCNVGYTDGAVAWLPTETLNRSNTYFTANGSYNFMWQ